MLDPFCVIDPFCVLDPLCVLDLFCVLDPLLRGPLVLHASQQERAARAPP